MKHAPWKRFGLLLASSVFVAGLTIPAWSENTPRLSNLDAIHAISAQQTKPTPQMGEVATTPAKAAGPLEAVTLVEEVEAKTVQKASKQTQQPILKLTPTGWLAQAKPMQPPTRSVQIAPQQALQTQPKPTPKPMAAATAKPAQSSAKVQAAPQQAAQGQPKTAAKTAPTQAKPEPAQSAKLANPKPISPKPVSEQAMMQQLLTRMTALEQEIKTQTKAINELQKQNAALLEARQKVMETPHSNPKPIKAQSAPATEAKTKKVAEKTAPASSKNN